MLFTVTVFNEKVVYRDGACGEMERNSLLYINIHASFYLAVSNLFLEVIKSVAAAAVLSSKFRLSEN